MQRQSVVLAEVDDFIKKWNNGEVVLTSQAKTMIVTYSKESEKSIFGRPKIQRKTLPDYLGYAVSTYQKSRELGYSGYAFSEACNLLDTIQRARAFRMLIDTKQQVADYEKQIEELKEQNARLRDLNSKLALENKRLRNLLPPGTKIGDSEIGDVDV